MQDWVVDFSTVGNAYQAISDSYNVLTDPNASNSEKASAGGAMFNSLNDVASLSNYLIKDINKQFGVTGLLTSSASLYIEFNNMSE